MTPEMLAAIVGAYQAQDVLVSYEDMANPRRVGQVVEHRAGEFRIAWNDDEGGETWSDLRQAGWRRVAYTFNFYVCDACAHTTSHGENEEPPSRCENCGNGSLSGFTTLDDAENYSQSILDES